jgi:hypothetical protein
MTLGVALGEALGVVLGEALGVVLGEALGVALGVVLGEALGVAAPQLELETVLVSIVTAPFRAKALPDTLVPA